MSNRRLIIDLACLAIFALLPLVAILLDEPYLVSLFTRLAIYGLAAASLDLLIGYAPWSVSVMLPSSASVAMWSVSSPSTLRNSCHCGVGRVAIARYWSGHWRCWYVPCLA